MNAPPPIGLRYRTSRWMLALFPGVAVLALVALWLSGLPRWAAGVATLAVCGWAGFALLRLLRPAIESLVWRSDGGVDLALGGAAGAVSPGVVQGTLQGARVLGPLIVLTLRRPQRQHQTLWLLPDNLDAGTRRRLRVRLATRSRDGLASGNADNG
ncbi:MAG TPA: protein YgfX [Rhodanobacteraceae bacterium]